ncbi:MAG: TetR/AcrR family transcriptional regulator [Pseudomonadota bacterium]
MSERSDAILDAAQARIRVGGYNGFSFREIAADVGIKSASVHHHFATKSDLAAAVARRYRIHFEEAVGAQIEAGTPPVEAWRTVFRTSLLEDGQMCLCGILAAEVDSLPAAVADEARAFFASGIESLAGACASGGQPAHGFAVRTMATLQGAMLVARALSDTRAFDDATAKLGAPAGG